MYRYVGGIAGLTGLEIYSVNNNVTLQGQAKIINCTYHAILSSDADYNGGIAGYADLERATLSGNTWHSQYPEIGNETNTNPVNPVSPDKPVTTGLATGIIKPVELSNIQWPVECGRNF